MLPFMIWFYFTLFYQGDRVIDSHDLKFIKTLIGLEFSSHLLSNDLNMTCIVVRTLRQKTTIYYGNGQIQSYLISFCLPTFQKGFSLVSVGAQAMTMHYMYRCSIAFEVPSAIHEKGVNLLKFARVFRRAENFLVIKLVRQRKLRTRQNWPTSNLCSNV